MSTLQLRAERTAASAADIEAAFARLDAPGAAGLYFGCDAGIAGLHPREATLIDAPALAIHIHTDGAELQPRSALGQALCAHAALASCLALAGRGPGRSAMGVLRAFLAACGNAPEALLLGALRFEAHRLAWPEPGAGEAPLGVFYFATRYWHRDAHGAWQHVALHIEGVPDLVDDAPQAYRPQPLHRHRRRCPHTRRAMTSPRAPMPPWWRAPSSCCAASRWSRSRSARAFAAACRLRPAPRSRGCVRSTPRP